MLKRIISAMLACVMAVSLMASCGNEASKPTTEGDVHLEVWVTDAEDQEETSNYQRYLKAANDFVANNEGYDVKVVGAVKAEKIMTALASGSGPDLVQAQWQTAGVWGSEGIIADLTDFVNNDAEFDKDDFIPAAWDRATYKGRIYSIPLSFNSSELYYNKKIMEEEGVEVPKTTGELKKLAVDLTTYDENGFITRAGYIPDYPWLDNVLWPIAAGAEWINMETNEITFDTPEMREAYQWQVDIYNEIGYDKLQTFKTSLGTGAQMPFVSNKVAMQFGGEWIPDDVAKYAPEDFEYGVTFVPYPDGKPELEGSMFCTIRAFMMNNENKNSKEDAWKLLSWMTGKNVAATLAEGMNGKGAMMTRVSALDYIQTLDTVDPIKKEIAEMMKNPNVKGFPMLAYVDEYLGVVADEMNKVFTDPANYTVEMATKAVQEKVQPIADAKPIN